MEIPHGPLSGHVLLLQADNDHIRAELLDGLEAVGAEVVGVADAIGADIALRRYQFSAVILSCDPTALKQESVLAMIRSLELPLVILASTEVPSIQGVTCHRVAPGDGVAGLIAVLAAAEPI